MAAAGQLAEMAPLYEARFLRRYAPGQLAEMAPLYEARFLRRYAPGPDERVRDEQHGGHCADAMTPSIEIDPPD